MRPFPDATRKDLEEVSKKHDLRIEQIILVAERIDLCTTATEAADVMRLCEEGTPCHNAATAKYAELLEQEMPAARTTQENLERLCMTAPTDADRARFIAEQATAFQEQLAKAETTLAVNDLIHRIVVWDKDSPLVSAALCKMIELANTHNFLLSAYERAYGMRLYDIARSAIKKSVEISTTLNEIRVALSRRTDSEDIEILAREKARQLAHTIADDGQERSLKKWKDIHDDALSLDEEAAFTVRQAWEKTCEQYLIKRLSLAAVREVYNNTPPHGIANISALRIWLIKYSESVKNAETFGEALMLYHAGRSHTKSRQEAFARFEELHQKALDEAKDLETAAKILASTPRTTRQFANTLDKIVGLCKTAEEAREIMHLFDFQHIPQQKKLLSKWAELCDSVEEASTLWKDECNKRPYLEMNLVVLDKMLQLSNNPSVIRMVFNLCKGFPCAAGRRLEKIALHKLIGVELAAKKTDE